MEKQHKSPMDFINREKNTVRPITDQLVDVLDIKTLQFLQTVVTGFEYHKERIVHNGHGLEGSLLSHECKHTFAMNELHLDDKKAFAELIVAALKAGYIEYGVLCEPFGVRVGDSPKICLQLFALSRYNNTYLKSLKQSFIHHHEK